ncbi:HNH endonuclease signature motif containing protein [Streptomyces griseus]|uniref:HNH endonuclease signature motif containing protein n=1 Tax=Streptomyces griseus TaxID=1911 RepID=UPI003701BFED
MKERFWSKVDKKGPWALRHGAPGRCWVWRASLRPDGYGQFRLDKRTIRAHRLAYELLIGSIPEGLVIDHLCRNRACVNPAHLEPVTLQVNTLRGFGYSAIAARKTHCPQGHPYDAKNTYRRPNGKRFCRACGNAASAVRYAKRRNTLH